MIEMTENLTESEDKNGEFLLNTAIYHAILLIIGIIILIIYPFMILVFRIDFEYELGNTIFFWPFFTLTITGTMLFLTISGRKKLRKANIYERFHKWMFYYHIFANIFYLIFVLLFSFSILYIIEKLISIIFGFYSFFFITLSISVLLIVGNVFSNDLRVKDPKEDKEASKGMFSVMTTYFGIILLANILGLIIPPYAMLTLNPNIDDVLAFFPWIFQTMILFIIGTMLYRAYSERKQLKHEGIFNKYFKNMYYFVILATIAYLLLDLLLAAFISLVADVIISLLVGYYAFMFITTLSCFILISLNCILKDFLADKAVESIKSSNAE